MLCWSRHAARSIYRQWFERWAWAIRLGHFTMDNSVLIVDDQPLITMALMKRLQAAGLQVNHAINGLAGVEAAAFHLPDVILMDINMPDISGFDAFERIRRMPMLSRVPVIFFSGHSDPNTTRRALDIGGLAFIVKPYDITQVLALIEGVLLRRQAA